MLKLARRFFSTRKSGIVEKFNSNQGFGFIRAVDGTDEHFFVHQSDINSSGFRSLKVKEPVEFDAVDAEGKSKRRAVNVTGPNGIGLKEARALRYQMRKAKYQHKDDEQAQTPLEHENTI